MELTKIFTPRAVAEHWEEVASNQIPYIGTALFPARKRPVLTWRGSRAARGFPFP